ncbi:mechanosensitive ion channel protein 6-like [Diospyros lotus]|uniref:mechanosensitive ion channel protein 6-like n=1 Tax=Diospyros lotus TaxID=55363 RepID=UPI00225A4B5C|nr:mechanosensitive ion channel protein 6-like [Diospyros lotus]
MDFPSSFKKSFKSHGSYNRHSRKISAGTSEDALSLEEQPILSEQRDDHRHCGEVNGAGDVNDRGREIIVKIDGVDDGAATPRVLSEANYGLWKYDEGTSARKDKMSGEADDPPSKLIGEFLTKQRMAGGEKYLDMDLDMMNDLLHHDRQSRKSPPLAESPVFNRNSISFNNRDRNHRVSTSKELKVSFQPPSFNMSTTESGLIQRRCYEESSDDDDDEEDDEKVSRRQSPRFSGTVDNGGGEVLRCTSSFQTSMMRTKTKSRLIDPPELDPRSGRFPKFSGPLRSGITSGMIGKPPEEEEDDPLFDEDIPEEYKRENLNALTLLQWISLILIVAALICSLSIQRLREKKVRGLAWWKWEVMILVLICGRLVSGWGIRIVVFFVERNFLLRKRVLYFVYGVRRAVQNCIWLGLVLIAWHCLFDDRVEKETHNNKFLAIVNQILFCFLVGSVLWLVKTLMVKVLASSFHVSTFFDRIQESLFNQYVIETLSGPPLVDLQNAKEDHERAMTEIQHLQNAGATLPPELRVINMAPPRSLSTKFSIAASKRLSQDEGISIDNLHKLSPKNISAWNMKRLMRIVRHGVLTTLDEQILESSNDDSNKQQIRSEYEAKVASRKIFHNVTRKGSKFIYLDDVMRFMQQDEALRTMALLEGSPDSDKISKATLKNWVVNSFRERKALALTLNDTKTAVNKLHQMVNVLIGVIILIVCLLILGIATSKFLLFISSQIVVAAFVFGNTCKTIFEAIIFVFVMHPFDVGDRCEIDGVQMIVEEMNILTTVFLRYDNQKIIFPNSTLATKPISNYYRSPDMGDSVEFFLHVATPAEKIALMKQRITSYIESKKDHWYASPLVVLMGLEDLKMIKMSVWMRHRMNHQDMGEKWQRRAQVAEEMVKIFKELDMEYRLLPLDINIRSMPPANSPTSTPSVVAF